LVVQPNELARERPYLEHTIDATRQAFDLDGIDVRIFDPQTNLTYDDLRNNNFTINNIRLWDTRPLLETNRQLQRIRLYYEFPNADVDRYLFSENPDNISTGNIVSNIQGSARQVLISARELDYNSVPDEAKTWVNEHLIYTHGYGFTMSPVNTANSSGLPDYFIRGIEHTASDRSVEQTVPVINPRIYYGELTDTYLMTPTEVEELDYPSGSENVYTRYQGDGGVAIGAWQRRLLFAKYLRDWRMIFTDNFTPETKLLMRRMIGDRVRAIAPFLRYDSDPYLVVADTHLPSHADADPDSPPSNLFWMIDAYTTSDRYPYSDPLDNDFNYIRNSVKVVVDAYHGTVEFYMADDHDPIIQAWNQIFPGMFRPLDTMPTSLLSHIRYPQDYYQVQSQQLMTYHMTDPRVFYNREDQWRSPQEIYADQQQPLEPYYLSMRLPTEDRGEFILLHPYTPSQRRNLIAWLAARSDGITSASPENNHYGKRLLYVFPKQRLIFGPEQIEARINQDPAISEQISLWNRTGSRAIQGNLLVIPIEESLLYVEPIYLEAEQDRLPTLVRVIAVYDNRIAMENNLADALRAVFDGDRPPAESQPSPAEDVIGMPPVNIAPNGIAL
ncbi:MAG: COG1615 family transporter, partial [Cyanothece sp. SIO2G6]|nr:COG1615 family transporter [Cyanothece sp. SIO2G6]